MGTTATSLHLSSPNGDPGLLIGEVEKAYRRLGYNKPKKLAETDLKQKIPENAMNKFAALAYAELLRGHTPAAVAAAEKAVANGPTIQVRFLAGRVFAETGETAQAKKMADSLAKETQAEAQAYSKIIEGKIALKGDPAFIGRLRLNELTEAVECTAMPWRPSEDWRAWTDNDDTGLATIPFS